MPDDARYKDHHLPYNADLNRAEARIRNFIIRAIDDGNIIRSCINCNHFREADEVCTMYGNQRPPARIIARGCDGHSKEIPF